MKNWKNKIAKIPNTFGIYLFYQNKKLIYVGKASSLRNRIKSYLKPKTNRPIELLINKVDQVNWRKTDSALEAVILEANYIKKFKPKYNIKEKDDKSWNFLAITKDKFPKLKAVREKNLNSTEYKYLFGPYPGGKTLEVLRLLHLLFNVSRCSYNQKKPCFDYQLKKCLGVCLAKISEKEYRKKAIRPLVLFLKGKKKNLIISLEKEMKNASLKQDFEEAKRIRDQLISLKKIADFSLLDKTFIKDNLKDRGLIKRIEGYDVSNLGNEIIVGSMVVFENKKELKKDYKKFKIKTKKIQNDTGSLSEIIERRFNHSEWPLPDLILIDGGIGQVNAVKKSLKKIIPIVGIAKGKKRNKNEFIYEKNYQKWVEENKDLLIKIRNEAHRFAINYQRSLKRKSLFLK